MRTEEFKKKIKTISGRIMRSTAYNEQSAAKTVRNMVEAGVRSGLMYRDREDDAALVMLDIAEARELVENWNVAIEAESDEAIDRSGDAMASYIRGLASQAALAFGEPTEKGK